jgi:hypothetical protein
MIWMVVVLPMINLSLEERTKAKVDTLTYHNSQKFLTRKFLKLMKSMKYPQLEEKPLKTTSI